MIYDGTYIPAFRHMSFDLSPTILTLERLRKEHSRSLRMTLFAETCRIHRKRKINKYVIR
jgi:hypothetical protein